MVALRSLDYEPQPTPHGRPASEAETVREERRRDFEEMCAEWESDFRGNHAIEGGIGG